MANNSKFVSQAKPKVAGAVWSAPAGVQLPTDATTALAEDFKCLGYVSEDGWTKSTEFTTSAVKAWGGDKVLESSEKSGESLKIKFIEALNADVLKMVYGADNVTGTLDEGLVVASKSGAPITHSIVIEEILKNGVLQRVVFPYAILNALGDETHKTTDPIGYECTFGIEADTNGVFHYEYKKTPASGD